MKAKKIDFKNIAAAVSTGAGFHFALEGVSKRVDFINANYGVVKSLSAGILGSGMLYFGKNETTKAAGYALLGVAGQAAAVKLATVMVSSDEPMQGIKKIKGRLRKFRNAAPAVRIAQKMREKMQNETPVMRSLPNQTASAANCATPYGQMALTDLFYN